MKLCILVLAFVAVAWAYPTGEKSETLPTVPLVITDYSSVVKDSGVHPQKDAPQESAESNESSESEESSEAKPIAPAKAIEVKPIPAAIDSKSSEELPQPIEPAKPLLEENKEEHKEEEKLIVEPIKAEEPIKEDVKLEEPKAEMKTLAHDDEEVPAPVALPTEIKTDEMPKNILEAASQPAAIAEDTIPLTSAKREEPAEETGIKQPAIPILKAEHGHGETVQEKFDETAVKSEGGSEYLRSPVAVAEPETKVEQPIVTEVHEHPVVKSAEIIAEKVEEKIEPKSALPEPTPAVEGKHEIVTEEKKPEAPKIKTETIAEPTQEGRTVRDAVKEDPIKIEETKPIEIEKKDGKIETPAVKTIATVAEEVKPIVGTKPIVEEVKPIVEEEKPLVKAIPHHKIAEAKQVSSEESVEESVELKKEEKPAAAEEVPKPLALPSSEGTQLLKKVEITEEKKEDEIKVPAAIATAELPKAVS